MTGEAAAAKESTGGRREQCNIVAMPETSPASKTSTCHKTVRSGTIYDFDMQERRRESLERAEKLKAELGDEPITGTDDRIAYRFVKRVFDFAFSAAVLVLLSWLFVIIAILVKVDDPKGPVFFKQTRVGKNGREFEMLKFRSMCVDAEEKLADLKELNEKTGPVFKIAEDPRITRVGKWLRKLSLDELPQFINVLRSDMSVVGPRPTADIPLLVFARHQHRCSDRLGVSGQARPYSASIQPSSLPSSVSANWEIGCGGDGSVSGRGASLSIGAIRHLLDQMRCGWLRSLFAAIGHRRQSLATFCRT